MIGALALLSQARAAHRGLAWDQTMEILAPLPWTPV